MYRIIKTDGTVLGTTERIQFIKVSSSGSYIEATPEDAQGVAFKSDPYDLVGHTEVAGIDEVIVVEVDAGDMIKETASYDELAAAIREGVNMVD